MGPDPNLNDRVDPRQYLRPVWARKWMILAIVIIATAATYLYENHKPRVYEASSQIFVQTSAVDQTLGSSLAFVDDQRVTANQARLVDTRTVAQNVAKRIGYKGDPGALLGGLTVTPDKDTDFVTITTHAGSSASAATLANAFADAFIDVRSAAARKQVAQALAEDQAQLTSLGTGKANLAARQQLEGQVRQLQAVQELPSGGATVTSRAFPGGAAISPHPRKSAIFAFLLSLLLAIGITFLIELFDRRIKSIDDIESTYPFPILAVVPHETDAAPIEDGALTFARSLREAFRSLRTSIGLTSLDKPTHRILVTSAVAGEGKSTVTRNLAVAYAEAGLRVAVVETDLRRPTLAGLFGVERRPGLTDVLAGGADVPEAMQKAQVRISSRAVALEAPVVATGGGTNGGTSNGHAATGELHILTSGPQPPNPPGVLAAERTHDLLDHLAKQVDILLIDSPPLLAVSDAVPLLSRVDAVVLVARLGHTTEAAGKRLVEIIGMIPDVRVSGVVVNDVESGRLQETGFEYYYYGPAGE
jgi:Mrp family chromosome partitioning ATPase/capsular polysaccharide biosynthesis protein